MLGSLIAGGASLIGGLVKNAFDSDRMEEANRFNAAQAEKQMRFQEKMSSTAYQRGMADMRAAGLNPILAYQKGGASAPSGTSASATFTPAMEVVSPAVSSALHATRLGAEVENMLEQNKNLRAQNANLHTENARIGATTANINADTKIKNELFQAALRDAAKAKTDQEFYDSPAGKVLRIIGLGASEVLPFLKGGR